MSSFWLEKVSAFEPVMAAWEADLFRTPELGFKEVKTRQKLVEYAKTFGLKLTQDFGINGFTLSIGEGHPHIGILAELDALVVPTHPLASETDHAAHSCGHHLQGVIMLSTLGLFKQAHLNNFKGKLTLFCVAAEEYIDLDYRRSLRESGQIQLFSGKQNLILQHAFDDVDLMLSSHTMGQTSRPMIELNSRLSGFIYKTLTFNGVSSHAAVAPHQGVNALNAMVLTQNAIALMRETFQEKDMIRVHLMSTLGGQSVNVVPSRTVLEGYVRSIDPKTLNLVNQRINTAAVHCAQALGAVCDIKDETGYLPLIQCEALSDVLRPYAIELVGENGVLDHQNGFASGDIGDISMFIPTIQFGFSGCKGIVHGADFAMANSTEALVNPVVLCLQTLDDLFSHPDKVVAIKESFVPKLTPEAYRHLHHLQ